MDIRKPVVIVVTPIQIGTLISAAETLLVMHPELSYEKIEEVVSAIGDVRVAIGLPRIAPR